MRQARMTATTAGLTIAALAVVLASACGEDVIFGGGAASAVGEWNGLHASLSIERLGGAIEYDCAHGGLSAVVQPDGLGRFAVPGVFVRERGGPIRDGEVPDSQPALYFGTIRGDALTLRMVVGTDTAGPYDLRRDGQVRLFKCL